MDAPADESVLEAAAAETRCFRDACVVIEGEKTLTLSGDAQSLVRAVEEIRAAHAVRSDTVFNLCFSRPQ